MNDNSKSDTLREEGLDKKKIIDYYDSFYKKRGIEAIRTYGDYEEKFFYLARHARFMENQRLLDVGCGTGQFLKVAKKASLEVHGLEISSEALGLAKINVPEAKLYLGEGEKLPFESNFFDYIACLGSLEHFADLDAAIKEMIRVAKDNARFLIMVPNRNYLFWKISGNIGTNQRKYREVLLDFNQWKSFFTSQGLEVEKLYRDNWPRRSVPIFKYKNLWRIMRRLVYHLIWLLLPFTYTYQFIFILKKFGVNSNK